MTTVPNAADILRAIAAGAPEWRLRAPDGTAGGKVSDDCEGYGHRPVGSSLDFTRHEGLEGEKA